MNDKIKKPQIVPSSIRKSVCIQVYPDCSIKVRVPKWLSQKKIDEVIKQKQDWIKKKIEYFQQNRREMPKPKEYINGENFYYLGQQYELKILETKKNSIKKTENMIFIYKTPKRNTKNILTKWFSDLAKEVFEERLKVNFEIFSKLYQYQFPVLKIRKMKSRWGSMSSRGCMTLSKNLIHTPIECIDYVIMHELCHLKYKNHGKRFHQLQAKFSPNSKDLKKKLESYSSKTRVF